MHKKRKTSGVHASSRKPTKKVCDKIKQRNKTEKNNTRVKMLLMEGGITLAEIVKRL